MPRSFDWKKLRELEDKEIKAWKDLIDAIADYNLLLNDQRGLKLFIKDELNTFTIYEEEKNKPPSGGRWNDSKREAAARERHPDLYERQDELAVLVSRAYADVQIAEATFKHVGRLMNMYSTLLRSYD